MPSLKGDQTQNCHSVSDSAANKYVFRSPSEKMIEIGVQDRTKKKSAADMVN